MVVPLMYSPRMRPASKFMLALACVSFLTITLSGFHLHAEFDEHDVAESHEQGLHQAFADDLEHESEHFDVAVFEPASGFSKVETFVASFAIPELAAQPVVDILWSKDAPRTVPWRYLRLRPSLRAPPISS